MDSNLIFVKTASGEEAMHQRTRMMQRNLRMVLILVDGKSTVSDLVLKIGNQQLTESSLAELEAGGFIAPRIEQDSLWSESKKVAQEIRSAALNKAIQAVSSEKASIKAQSKPPESAPEFSLPADSAFSQSVFPFPPMPFSNVDRPVMPPVADTGKRPEKKAAKSTDVLGKWTKSLKGLFSGGEPVESAAVSIKPIRRKGRGGSLTWSAIATLAFLFLIVLAVLVVMFFPFGVFRSNVEDAMARSFGRPVAVGGIRGEIYPKPGLVLTDVKIGADDDALRIGEIRVLPEPQTILEPRVMLRQVVLSGVTLPVELVGGLPKVFASLAAPTSRFGLRSVRFEKTALSFAGLELRDLEGEVQQEATGALRGVQLQSLDRGLNVAVKPVGTGAELSLEALAWRPSETSRLVISSASLKGKFEDGALTLREIELHVFDGVVKGVAILRTEKSRSLVGEVEYERIDAAHLGEVLGVGQLLSGSASGSLRFSALAASWASIFSAMDGEGSFSVDRGSVRGIDLPEAVRRASRGAVQGGATQFEQLSGKIRVSESGYQFSSVSINSGLMQSTGSVEVSKDLKLKGRLELQMRGTANQMRMPVSLAGTLMLPEVRAGGN